MLKCAVYTWIELMEMHYMGNLLNIMKNITDFSPGCESPELNSPRPSLKPHTNPLPPETWTITRIFVQFEVSCIRTKHFSHTTVCT